MLVTVSTLILSSFTPPVPTTIINANGVENVALKGPFPLQRYTATESSAVVIFTGNGHRGRR
jgi:hypothetical protein